jgi:hypothetical protein
MAADCQLLYWYISVAPDQYFLLTNFPVGNEFAPQVLSFK